MRRAVSFEKTMMVGKIECRKIEDKMVGGIIDKMDMGLGGLREQVMYREARRAAVHRVTKSCT